MPLSSTKVSAIPPASRSKRCGVGGARGQSARGFVQPAEPIGDVLLAPDRDRESISAVRARCGETHFDHCGSPWDILDSENAARTAQKEPAPPPARRIALQNNAAIAGSGLRCNRLSLLPGPELVVCEDFPIDLLDRAAVAAVGPLCGLGAGKPAFGSDRAAAAGPPPASAAPSAPAASPAHAPGTPAAAPGTEAPAEITFSADQLVYEQGNDTVTASGTVRMIREGYNLRADSVTWNRHTGEVHANGDVRVLSPGGDVAYADSVQLDDTLKDGVVQNLLLVLADGGRLAADHRDAAQRLYDALSRRLHALRRHQRQWLPQEPDLADQRGPRRPRSGPPPHLLSGRAAEPVRHAAHPPARPLPPGRHPGQWRLRLPGSRDTLQQAQRPRDRSALLLPLLAPTATSRSRRTSTPTCCPCSKPNIAS